MAEELGTAVIGGAIFFAWFFAVVKASDAGHTVAAWIVGLAPLIVVALGFMGAFR